VISISLFNLRRDKTGSSESLITKEKRNQIIK